MASSAKLIKLALVVMVAMSVPIAHAVTCGQVTRNLTPCLTYLRSGGAPSASCCNGIRTVNNLGRTTADRQTICTCLKNAAAGFPGVNPTFAQELPGKCGVPVPYKISPSTECSSVQ